MALAASSQCEADYGRFLRAKSFDGTTEEEGAELWALKSEELIKAVDKIR